MNLTELNKIEESIVSSIKGMFTGQGGFQTKVQDIFIKDFVQDAITSLNNGVKGGLIDANVKSTPASATAASNAAPAPAAAPASCPYRDARTAPAQHWAPGRWRASGRRVAARAALAGGDGSAG
jgi:hypothetical protein